MRFSGRMGLVTLGTALLAVTSSPRQAAAGAPEASRAPLPSRSNLSAGLRVDRALRADPNAAEDVVVRFVKDPTPSERAAWRARGVDLEDAHMASGAYLARADASGLRALASSSNVARVEGADTPFLRPLDAVMSSEVGLDDAERATVTRDGTILDGTGLALGDYDADTFVFHPELFHADGGTFAWIDVDGDGVFRPGIDAIDLDRNGAAGEGEIASALHVKLLDLSFKEVQPHDGFDPAIDYVFLDQNGNGQRDFGKGFTEDTPAFGEPIFVVDDANGDGVLGPSERLLRLGTSKYARIWKKGKVYTRGDADHGILAYGVDLLDDLGSAFTPEHGTLIGSVMVGGTTARRYHGVAPGADLYLAVAGQIAGFDWLAKQHLAAVGIPYGSVLGGPLDGSSELEQAVDAIWTSGSFPSVSVGNAAGTKGHVAVDVDPLVPETIHFSVGATQGIYLSVLVADPKAKVALELAAPGGAFTPVSETFSLGAGTDGAAGTDVSPRGTSWTAVSVAGSLAAGDYQLKITLTADAHRVVHVYNEMSSGLPAPFAGPDDPSTTLGSPGTADHSFAAPGYVIHEGRDYGATDPFGALATFSSRGPRVDGAHVLGVAAPVNPVGATFVKTDPSQIAFRAWPGTSNAAPIVAGVAGLLRQMYPGETVSQIAARLTRGARRDDAVTSDVDAWGAGKVDLAHAGDLSVTAAPAPQVSLEVPGRAAPGSRIRAHLVVEGGGPNLAARWDKDYDGTFDTEWGGLDDQDIDVGDAFPLGIDVEVHDDHGNVVRATALVERGDAPADDVATSGCSLAAPAPARAPGRRSGPPGALALVFALGAGLAAVVRRRGARSRST